MSETDSSPSATSNLFLGEAKVSGNHVRVSYVDEYGNEKANSGDVPEPSPTPTRTPTPTPKPTEPDRDISIKFGYTPAKSGDTAIIFIRDNYLGTTIPCTVEWTNIKTAMPSESVWNVVSGAPNRKSFTTDCHYDGNTPIALHPRPQVFVDGWEYSINSVGRGHLSLNNKVDAGSAIRMEFHYEVVDNFDAQTHLARIFSTSDKVGEWVALREVKSESDASPSSASYLYRGEVEISDNEASLAVGDGQVRVRQRSRLGAAYYDDGGRQRGKVWVGLDLPTPHAHADTKPFAYAYGVATGPRHLNQIRQYASEERRHGDNLHPTTTTSARLFPALSSASEYRLECRHWRAA